MNELPVTLRATAALGVVGLALALLWGGYGFTPIFVVGLAFIAVVWRQTETKEVDQ